MQLFRIVLHGRHPYGCPPEEAEAAALFFYACSGLLSCGMGVFGKLAGATGLHFFALVAARSAVLCLMLVPVLLKRQVNPFEINATFPLLVLRGVCGFASLSGWYLSLYLLPLSDANSLNFISPVIVALLAPILLKEPTPRAVYASLPFCLAGMLLVAQPTWLFGASAAPTSTLGVAAGVLQAVFSAGSKLTIRALNKHNEPLESILFSMGFISLLGAIAGCLALPGRQLGAPAQAAGWAWLAATSFLALVVQATFTASLRKCNASKAASLDYLSLLWMLLADGLIFRKLPNAMSMAGAAVIGSASLAAIVWSARKPSAAAGGAAAAGKDGMHAKPKPQRFKVEHYLGSQKPGGHKAAGKSGRAASTGQAGGDGGGSENEGESVSLIKAAACGAEDSVSSGCSQQEEGEGGHGRSKAEAALASGLLAGGAAPGSPAGRAKLALAGCQQTDSSKSWRLGTEVELAAGRAEAGAAGEEACPGGHLGAGLGRASEPAGSGAKNGAQLQAVAVASAPAAMRTSTEKEEALAAAGK